MNLEPGITWSSLPEYLHKAADAVINIIVRKIVKNYFLFQCNMFWVLRIASSVLVGSVFYLIEHFVLYLLTFVPVRLFFSSLILPRINKPDTALITLVTKISLPVGRL